VLERYATHTLHKHCCDSLKRSGNTLDLVVTNEENRINKILYQPSLRLSHHVSSTFVTVPLINKFTHVRRLHASI